MRNLISKFILILVLSLISSVTYAKEVQLPVLMFHGVNNISVKQDVNTYNNSITPKKFEELLQKLQSNKFKTISLKELTDDKLFSRLEKGEKLVLLTFDDGYADYYENAIPLLEKYKFKAVNGIITGSVGKENYMSEKQIKELYKKGFEFVSHSVNHKNMDSLSKEYQIKELAESKAYLEKLLGTKIEGFTYPAGRYNQNTLNALKSLGYKFAFTTKNGKLSKKDSFLEIYRKRIDNRSTVNNVIENLLKY